MSRATENLASFTAESVTEGHPDKVADQISDAVLDAHLGPDEKIRVACETLVTRDTVVLAGEITSRRRVDYDTLVRDLVRKIGYDRQEEGFCYNNCSVQVLLHEQSADIARGVDTGGAGDQGTMYGYATDECPALIPLPLHLAHTLVRRLTEARRTRVLPWLRPDGKSQVTVQYDDGRPVRIACVVLSAQHIEDVTAEEVHEGLLREVVRHTLPEDLLDEKTVYKVNPTGRFVNGGPAADSGLTGRKIMVDSYGGFIPHGGGAFSGKDGTKQDRAGAYMARRVAKSLVAAGLARRVVVGLSYAIGVAKPVSVTVDTFGTGTKGPDARLAELVSRTWSLAPRDIIETLELRKPGFVRTAAYGHFGRTDADFTWEKVDEIR